MRSFKHILAVLVVAVLAAIMAGTAKADPRISATATVNNSTRQVTFTWNVPTSSWGGAVIINPTSLTDSTGELPFDAPGDQTITFEDMTTGGLTTWTTLPLYMSITTPTTVYAQVQLIDPFGDGSCTQGIVGANCDSQVIPIVIQPICSQVETAAGYYKTVTVTAGYYKTVVVTAAYYTKKLVARAHWLKRHGQKVKWSKRYHRPQYTKRHGFVWVKARYKRIFHPAVTNQEWVPPVTTQEWVPPVYSTQCH